jgi:hypothetical protein
LPTVNDAVPENDGWAMPVADLNHLIERVYVAPSSSPELSARVQAAMDARRPPWRSAHRCQR